MKLLSLLALTLLSLLTASASPAELFGQYSHASTAGTTDRNLGRNFLRSTNDEGSQFTAMMLLRFGLSGARD